MYPVAPTSLILFVKRISDVLVQEFASIAQETQSGWRMVV
jgi:hypothetical protein